VGLKATHKISPLEELVGGRSPSSSQRLTGMMVYLIDKSVPDIMWCKLDSKVFGFKKDLYICFYTSNLLTLS
jgi:hypothetical protein